MAARLNFQQEKHQRHFLFSAIPAEGEKSLQQKIESLGGKVVHPAKNTFSPLCTHVIARDFSPTEKVLGALAGGKWLLSVRYIQDSFKEGYWLKEEEYEYANFNKIAAYHRQRREMRKCGLYYGWKILVLMDSPTSSRTFKRILAAGGAEVASKEDISDVDFVITKKEHIKYAQATVSCLIPLVDVTYIKETLIFRTAPSDLKKCDLRNQWEFETTHKSAVSTASRITPNKQGSHASSKRSLSETFLAKRKQICSQPKQATLTQFLKPLVNEPSLNKKPSEERQSAAENNYNSISDSVANSRQCNILPRVPVVYYDVEDEPQIIGIIKRQQSERKPEDIHVINKRQQSERKPEDIHVISKRQQNERKPEDIHVISKRQQNERIPEDIHVISKRQQNESKPENIHVISKRQQNERKPEDIIPMISKRQQTERKPKDIICVPSTTHHLKVKECYVILGKKVDEKYLCVSEPPSNEALLLKYDTQFEQFKSDSISLKQLPRRHSIESHSTTYPEQLHKETVPSKHMSRRQLLQCNASSSEELPKEVLPTKTPTFTLTKLHAKKVIVNFLKTRQYLSEVCCTSMLSIPIGCEHYSSIESKRCEREIDPQQVLDTPNYNKLLVGEHRELTAREINLYTCFIAPEIHDQELHVHGLDTLLIQLSTYLYPPPAILGSLLKDLVLETPFRIVHSRALRVAYRVLSFHSPSTTKMREYYACVLETAMQPHTSGNYIAWKFIKSVIHCASSKDNDEEILPSQNMEKEKGFDRATKALNLLEFLTILITEDIRNSAYGKAVEELLTWDIFWGSSRTCNVLPPPVKQLLHLWMSQQITSLALRWYLAQLVSVLLEVMWKLSGHPLVPVTALPDTLAAVKMEIGIHIQGLSSQQSLKVISSLHTPWAQSVVSFIILQEITQCPKEITLSSIVDLFYSTCKHSNSSAALKPESEGKAHNSLKEESPRACKRRPILNINKKNSKGETALLCACIKNDVEQVKHLLREPGVDINLTDHSGWTPLHEAALRGHAKCIELILSHDAQNNTGTLNSQLKKGGPLSIFSADFKERRTPLHDAVIANELESVKLLLDYGGEDLLKARKIDGKTAFDLASTEEMLRLLKTYKNISVDCRTRSISPTMEDQKYHRELFSILANCYLEISGNRYIIHAIKKCIGKVKENKKAKETEKVKDDMDYECQAVNENMKKKTSKRHEPLFSDLIENEILQSLSEFEDEAVLKIYQCIRLDKEVYRKQRLLQSSAQVKKIDVKHFFKTLCL